MFLLRFVEVGVEVTKEAAGAVWGYSQPVLSNITSTTAAYALEALSKSIDMIQRRGEDTYNMINNAIVELVEADIEQQELVTQLNSTHNQDSGELVRNDPTTTGQGSRDFVYSISEPIKGVASSALASVPEIKIDGFKGSDDNKYVSTRPAVMADVEPGSLVPSENSPPRRV